MTSEWKKSDLFDVVNIIGGGTPKRSVTEYWGGDIPWLSIVDFNNDLRKVSNAKESITELGLNKSSTKILKKGQVIISARGTVGKLAQLAKPMAFNQSCYGLDAKKEYLTNDFLYYILKIKISNFKGVSHGSVFDTITKDTFKKIEVSIPPINYQNKITHILTTLDDKIEFNKKINQTLESIAQAIFKSWFVNFDPVHAKASANSEDEYDAIAKWLGISREILDLFPSEFEESELGLIPKGWFYTKLENDFNIVMGQSPSGSTYNEVGNGIPFFQGNADFGFRYPSNRVYCTDPKRFAKAGQTLISVRAPVGAINMAYEDCSIGRGLCAVSYKLNLDSYTYYSMRNLKNYLKSFENNGTVFGCINKKSFNEIPYLKPNQKIITAFEKVIKYIDKMIFLKTSAVNTTTKLRDLLLPKLLSGEIEVSNLNLEPEHD